jgi:hypothetical protein
MANCVFRQSTRPAPLPRRLSEDSLLEEAEAGVGDNETRNSFKKIYIFLSSAGFWPKSSSINGDLGIRLSGFY